MDDTTRGLGGRGASDAHRPEAATDPATERRTREIQQEIQETREELSETIGAIQDRLRPSNIVADATQRVKTATTEKVKSMAETASDTAQDVVRGTRDRAYDIVEGARQNPIPALMIGAGVAWMLMDRARAGGNGPSGSRRGWSDYSSRANRTYEGSDQSFRSTLSGQGYDADEYQTRGPSWSDTGGTEVSHRAREMAHQAQEKARRVQNGFQRLLQDNPLLVGAAAVLVGAAVGAALPETEKENELMGEARDTVVDRAQTMARNAASSVEDVAAEAIDKVAERADTRDQ